MLYFIIPYLAVLLLMLLVCIERQQLGLYTDEDSPPMDFDSDEQTLFRLPHDSSPTVTTLHGLFYRSL